MSDFLPRSFPQPITIYPVGVPIPALDPDIITAPVSFSCYWYSYVIGCLKALKLDSTWLTETEDELSTTLQQVDSLLEIFSAAFDAGCGGLIFPPFSCPYDFDPTHDAGWFAVSHFGGFTPTDCGVRDLLTGRWKSSTMVSGGGLYLNGMYIQVNFPATTLISSVIINLSLSVGDFSASPGFRQIQSQITLAGANVATSPLVDPVVQGDSNFDLAIPPGVYTCDSLNLYAFDAATNNPLAIGDLIVNSVTMTGAGNPVCT